MSKGLSEMCPLGGKMAKIWLKLQENGKKKSQMAKVMAKEKYILARTLRSYVLTGSVRSFLCKSVWFPLFLALGIAAVSLQSH